MIQTVYQGTVFNLQRFSLNDGPGIRTTVFLKGCPLRCIWCHNPESKSAAPQLMYNPAKCYGCGECAAVCPEGCHTVSEGVHLLERSRCIGCGECARFCPGALELMGRTRTVEEVMQTVLRDTDFYKKSGGGMTLSGGEPFAQPGFALALLAAAKENGLHTCVETCGYVKTAILLQAVPFADLFLLDWKLTDPLLHKQYTGVDNDLILRNLQTLDGAGARIVLRCPIIPGVNDTEQHFAGIGDLTHRFAAICRVELEPYHPLGREKAAQLEMDYPLQELGFPAEDTVSDWLQAIRERAACPVKKA